MPRLLIIVAVAASIAGTIYFVEWRDTNKEIQESKVLSESQIKSADLAVEGAEKLRAAHDKIAGEIKAAREEAEFIRNESAAKK